MNFNRQTYRPSANACYVREENLDEARRDFAIQCQGIQRIDCDPIIGQGWICSSEQIGLYTPGNIAGSDGRNVNPGGDDTRQTCNNTTSNTTNNSSNTSNNNAINNTSNNS